MPTPIRAFLFDIDGTLLKTNDAHVDTWLDALKAFDYRVGRDRIEIEIGKGGDLLVPSILGRSVEKKEGDALRKKQGELFKKRIERDGVKLFDGVDELFSEVRRRGLRIALATSSSPENLKVIEEHSGRRFEEMADVVTTKKDAEVSKPAPDILHAACAKLGEDPLRCVMIGDSLFDAGAARNAGVSFAGVTSGFVGEDAFVEAGARFIAKDLNHMRESLDELISEASRSMVKFDQGVLTAMMDKALGAARAGLSEREVPIGAALFCRDGKLLATGHNRACATRDVTLHAEMDALRKLAGREHEIDKGATLVSTLEPCVMCLGAAMEIGVDVVVFGHSAPADGGAARVSPPRSPENRLPRVRGGIGAEEARALFKKWLAEVGTPRQRPYIEQLLAESKR